MLIFVLKAFYFSRLRAVLTTLLPALLLMTTSLSAESLRVAVSANFTPTLTAIKTEFENQTGHKIEIISGATGVLFQQINHGAPFDVFMAADTLRPQRLVDNQLALSHSLNIYAYGQLALWSNTTNITSITMLQEHQGLLAIANPTFAPYGKAAQQVLTNTVRKFSHKTKLILGNNISQTFQQARSGNVPLAIVAYSQLKSNNLSGYLIPENLYTPIAQAIVTLAHSQRKQLAAEFTRFIMSPAIQQRIHQAGYRTIKSR